MTDNQEPTSHEIDNIQVNIGSEPLPEQGKIIGSSIPRPFTCLSLIHQWQPMGIRVVVDLPFTGDDRSFLFAIRNGPFIPEPWINIPSSGSRPLTSSYLWNNTRNVVHAFPRRVPEFPANYPIHITQYDQPPVIATLATAFRRWRGTMHYQARVVAGFATQGYIFVGSLKNIQSNIDTYDEYKVPFFLPRGDSSYREVMQNAYVRADTSMYRHLEVAMPFEYSVPWYDQYNWLEQRMWGANQLRQYSSPHFDNWIVFGVRGNLAATTQGAQITFELEYRCDEDFQFSDPGLLPLRHCFTSYNKGVLDQQNVFPSPVRTIPSTEFTSDGVGIATKV